MSVMFKIKDWGAAVISWICWLGMAINIVWFLVALVQDKLSPTQTFHDWSHPLSWWKIVLAISTVIGFGLICYMLDIVRNGPDRRAGNRQAKRTQDIP